MKILESLIIVITLFFSINVTASTLQCIKFRKGETPKIILQINKNLNIIICGNTKDKKAENQYQMSEFEIDYYYKNKGKDLLIASTLDEYLVSIDYKSKKLTLDKLIFINKFIPFIRYKLNCNKEVCSIDEEKCILDIGKEKDLYSKIINSEKNLLGKSKKDEFFITKILHAALTGNKKAQDFLYLVNIKKDVSEGATEEEMISAKRIYITAKNKCELETAVNKK